MSTLPMKKSFQFSQQVNIKVRPEEKRRIKVLTDNGVEFADVARDYLIKAIEYAEKELALKQKVEAEAS